MDNLMSPKAVLETTRVTKKPTTPVAANCPGGGKLSYLSRIKATAAESSSHSAAISSAADCDSSKIANKRK